MIKYYYILIFYLGVCWWNITPGAERQIDGIIRDAVTKQPLKGANIYLSISRIGTVSDASGSFTLHINQTDPLDSLIITFMGYIPFKESISGVSEKLEIFLKPISLDYGEEIIIRAEREHIIRHDIPQSVTKIEFAEIARYGSSEIADILKPLPAIRMEGNDLDGRRIYIRGSNSDEVNVYLDGVLINNLRFDNSADLSVVPVENIENLEILKGGNSAFLGNGAFGGVVNITTQLPEKSGILLKGKIGSFDSEYLLGNASVMFSKKMGLSYFGQYHSFSPEIEYFSNEKYSDKTPNKQITTHRQNHLLTLNYFTTHGQYLTRILTYFTSYRKPFWKNDDLNLLSVLSYTGEILGARDFSINVNHFYTQNQITRQPDTDLEYHNKYFTNRFNFNAAKKFSYRLAEIQLYGEYLHDDLKNEAHISGSNFKSQLNEEYFYDNKAALSAVFAFSDHLTRLPDLSWKTYLGLRGDAVASGHKDISPTVGAKIEYRLPKWEISSYLNFGKNVKYPTLIQNAYLRDMYIISSIDTNQNRLKPEYSNSAEIGWQVSYNLGSRFLNQITFLLEIFHHSVYNKLFNRSIERDLAFLQIGRNVTNGFESSLKLNELWKRFFLTLSIMNLDISDPLFYSFKPEKSMSVNLNYTSPLGIYFNSTLFYEGSSIAWYIDMNEEIQTEKLNSFYDLDLTAGMKIHLFKTELDWQVAGYNIFDHCGYNYYYLKKRYLQASVAIRL